MTETTSVAPPPVWIQRDYGGMTLREYFAAHAPAEPQPWFMPVMATPRPAYPGEYSTALPIQQIVDHQTTVVRAQDEWDLARSVARYAQWPWAWADAVLAARHTTGGVRW